MRFALINTVPPGFCRKMHLLAPGGRLDDLAELSRDQLQDVGLSPTHMEAIRGFAEWKRIGVPPALGLLMWFLESTQRPDGSFLRTEDAPEPSIGVAIRFLQIAGQIGIDRAECDSVDRAAHWLENSIDDDGIIRMPIAGETDFGMMARAVRSLDYVATEPEHHERINRACQPLMGARQDGPKWPTYPGSDVATGTTSLVIAAAAQCPQHFELEPDPTWLLEVRNSDGGWGEHADSPSRVDNTFWATRGCLAGGHGINADEIDVQAMVDQSQSYQVVMGERCKLLLDQAADDEIATMAVEALTDEADRYAETTLRGLVLAEQSSRSAGVESSMVAGRAQLPVRTPEFMRDEPPLYDELAEVSSRRRWLGLVEWAAKQRVAESSIGWLIGLSAAIALIGEEFVAGVSSLGPTVVSLIIGFEIMLALGWLTARRGRRTLVAVLPHYAFANALAAALVILITRPESMRVGQLSAVALTLLFGLVIEIVSIATDKADLLNRLGDD